VGRPKSGRQDREEGELVTASAATVSKPFAHTPDFGLEKKGIQSSFSMYQNQLVLIQKKQ
jgi:hypothetical protein